MAVLGDWMENERSRSRRALGVCRAQSGLQGVVGANRIVGGAGALLVKMG